MKWIYILILSLFCFQQADAQADSIPVYKRFTGLPVFSMMKIPDSIKFTRDNLSKKKATIIMLFSPDCDHCVQATNDLLQNITLFKNVQILMVSSLDFKFMQKFYQDHKIADYPNITMGRDGSFYLGTFYNLRSYPSLYLYNKKGKFVKEFESNFKMETVAGFL